MKQLFIEERPDGVYTAIAHEGRLREVFIDKRENGSALGRVYAGAVRNVLPSQFVFIDIGGQKNAFMNNPPKDALRVGQSVLVQVYKDASGAKGALVGREINLSGRLVIVNASGGVGVSAKIRGAKERKRLRGIVLAALPEGCGAIVRTNAAGKGAEEIGAEARQLAAQLADITARARYVRPPALLYQDNRLLNDLLSDDVDELIVSGEALYEAARQTLAWTRPAPRAALKLEKPGLFERYGLLRQIRQALQKDVELPCGGFITLEQTEACVIIDVNTGHYPGRTDFRETALTANLEAAACIAEQLALRNLSGMIIVDFIDMAAHEDKAALLRAFRSHIRKDRIKTEIVGMTELGLVQLTRKKTRESLSRLLEQPCPHCGGTGRTADRLFL